MKLAAYLNGGNPTGKRIRRFIFAKKIRVSPQTITGYCDGSIWPGRDKMELMQQETGGLVTPNDFLQHSEAAE
jgi:hypothetical protein